MASEAVGVDEVSVDAEAASGWVAVMAEVARPVRVATISRSSRTGAKVVRAAEAAEAKVVAAVVL